MDVENFKVLDQFNTVLSSAIRLKQLFDLNEDIQQLKSQYELLVKDIEYLKKLAGEEVLSEARLFRHLSWIKQRLDESRPDLCITDIYDICFNDLFYAQKLFLRNSSSDATAISDVGILTQQLKMLDERDPDAPSWLLITEKYLKRFFPNESINLRKYKSIAAEYGFTTAERIRYREILVGYIKLLEMDLKNTGPADKWLRIDSDIAKVSKSRFETDHFADAVEAAFKEINERVKKSFREKTGKEEDGDSLMRNAFSVKNPVFFLADNNTESGRNIQQGYMDIFAGSMKGIRNPKAHANLDVHPEEAWEMIVLASHLMRMWKKYN